MAISAALRRVAAFAPAAIRATHPINRSAPVLRALLPRGPTPAYRLARFSSSASSPAAGKPASDKDLLVVIDSEIKCAEETDDHDRVEEIPENFPFKIQDVKGTNTVTLRRTYQGEDIEITVSMPSLVTGNEPEPADENKDDDGTPADSCLPLTVVVTKGDGTGLEFTCTAYPDAVDIDAMSVKQNKDSEEEMMAYEGPEFADLDENLQKAFHKYLQMRGVTPMYTNYLHEYMINKDSREYLFWLKNLKQFMQK